MDFNQSPLLVVWEVTQACDLACHQCRAAIQPERDPGELTTAEARLLLNEVKRFGNPLMIFTGGDPLKRADIFELASYSVATGLRTNITPSATPLLTAAAIDRFKSCGISRMAISLDGPDAPAQEEFRGVSGTFESAMFALEHARKVGLDTQVQTTVTRKNLARLGHIAEIVAQVHAKMWSVFFEVKPCSEVTPDDLTAEEYEEIFAFLYDISKVAPFEVKTVEGPQYRRYIAQRLKAEHGGRGGANGRMLWRTTGVSEGRGFVFISHTGEIYPSGFLPVSAGNVRDVSLVDAYRDSSLFQSLRSSEAREGKCSYCDYQKLCGGSRARAFAMTGNYLEGDPLCCYEPQKQAEMAKA